MTAFSYHFTKRAIIFFNGVHVVVQFGPWFTFYIPLSQTRSDHTLPY